MQERVSNEDIRIAMRLNPVLEPFLLDLLDARKRIRALERAIDETGRLDSQMIAGARAAGEER